MFVSNWFSVACDIACKCYSRYCMLSQLFQFVYYCVVFCFFFKQKTAYELLRSLVGSEMCIRDSTLLIGTWKRMALDVCFRKEICKVLIYDIQNEYRLSLIHI